MVVAQLVVWSLATLEVCSSYPVISRFLAINCTYIKDEHKEKEAEFLHCPILKITFLNGPFPASFSFIFVFSNKHYNFYKK